MGQLTDANNFLNAIESYRKQILLDCGLVEEKLYGDETPSITSNDFRKYRKSRLTIEVDYYSGKTIIHNNTTHNELENSLIPDHKGDHTCENNALSPYVKCAVNPEGDCKTCVHYEKKKII